MILQISVVKKAILLSRGRRGGRGFAENVFGSGGGEWPAESALGSELCSALGVAADELGVFYGLL